MVADASPIRYACVARGAAILAGAGAGAGGEAEEEGLEALAAQCVEKAPPYHRHYSHTAKGRTYSFLMEEPFVYFAVYAESLGRAQGLHFLGRVRSAFLKTTKSRDAGIRDPPDPGSFRQEFGPVLRYLMQMRPPSSVPAGADYELEQKTEGKAAGAVNRESVDISCAEAAAMFGRPVKYEKISRSLSRKENGGGSDGDFARDVKSPAGFDGDADGECGPLAEKSGGHGGRDGRQRARKVWRRHVRVVLVIDFVVCLVLFCVWLSICKGFQCINR